VQVQDRLYIILKNTQKNIFSSSEEEIMILSITHYCDKNRQFIWQCSRNL